MNWYLGYYKNDARARLDLLLDRGADINATMNESSSEFAGYTLLLYRTELGSRYREPSAYADAVHLLERGTEPCRWRRHDLCEDADPAPGALRANAARAAGVQGSLGLGPNAWDPPPAGVTFLDRCYCGRAVDFVFAMISPLTSIFALAAEVGLRPDRYHVGFGARPGR